MSGLSACDQYEQLDNVIKYLNDQIIKFKYDIETCDNSMSYCYLLGKSGQALSTIAYIGELKNEMMRLEDENMEFK